MTYLKNLEGLNLCFDEDRLKVYNHIIELWMEKSFLTVGFLYFSNFVDIRKDSLLKEKFLKYDVVLPDGVGLLFYVKKIFNINIPNLNGTDFLPILLKELEYNSIEFNFYGASEKNIKDCACNYKVNYFQDGYHDFDFSKISDNSVLLIGLGIKRHEEFIENNLEKIKEKKLLVISVGGFFDFCSGNVKRAPSFIRKIKLEFLYRLLLNPKQHIKKNVNNLMVFIYVFKDKK